MAGLLGAPSRYQTTVDVNNGQDKQTFEQAADSEYDVSVSQNLATVTIPAVITTNRGEWGPGNFFNDWNRNLSNFTGTGYLSDANIEVRLWGKDRDHTGTENSEMSILDSNRDRLDTYTLNPTATSNWYDVSNLENEFEGYVTAASGQRHFDFEAEYRITTVNGLSYGGVTKA